MGDIARASRAERFIKEFNKDWVKKKGYQFHNTVCQSLGYDEYAQVVRHYVTLKEISGDETELMGTLEIYGPEGDDCEALAECLAEWLEGTKEEMIERLKKANLWR
jgi:hypothetical protein